MAEKKRRPPAKTLEARENQLKSLAIDLAEKQLREGTASSQTINHYLKLASTREQLEQEKIAKENSLLEAKVEELASRVRTEELMAEAIQAFTKYKGDSDEYYEE